MSEANLPMAMPRVRVENGEARADSRDVAAHFGMRHDNVLRAYRGIKCSAEFRALNFEECRINDLTGASLSHLSLTFEGFMFLALGFTGERADALKEQWIIAFREAMNGRRGRSLTLAARFESMMDAVGRVAIGTAALQTDMREVKTGLHVVREQVAEHGHEIRRLSERIDKKTSVRKALFRPVRADHALVLAEKYGGKCEVCRDTVIVDAQGNELPNSRGDHAARVDDPTFTRTWLICDCCNRKFGTGALDRNRYANRFLDYQATAAEFFRAHPYRSKGGAVARRPVGRHERTDPRQPSLLLPL